MYKAIKKDDSPYQRYRDLITSGNISEAKRVREKLLKVWEKKNGMKVKCEEATADGIDVVAIFSDM